MSAATLMSMRLILAWACVERTNIARVSPGRLMSSVYWPLPVMKRRSSLRRTAAPIPVALMAISFPSVPLLGGLLHAGFHGAGAGCDRLDDVVIAGTAAEIAVELFADGVIVELIGLAVDHVDRRHDHAGGAKAALQTVMLAEGFLHRVQLSAVGDPLDGGDIRPFRLPGEHGAGFARLAADMHDAASALRGVAADMRSRQAQ